MEEDSAELLVQIEVHHHKYKKHLEVGTEMVRTQSVGNPVTDSEVDSGVVVDLVELSIRIVIRHMYNYRQETDLQVKAKDLLEAVNLAERLEMEEE